MIGKHDVAARKHNAAGGMVFGNQMEQGAIPRRLIGMGGGASSFLPDANAYAPNSAKDCW